jgi:hypothetical protein
MLSRQKTSAAINRRMSDPRFNWLDAPPVARQRLWLIKRAAAALVPKPAAGEGERAAQGKV